MAELLKRLAPRMLEFADIDHGELARGFLVLHLQFAWAKFQIRFGEVNYASDQQIPAGVSYASAAICETGSEEWPYQVTLVCTVFPPDFDEDMATGAEAADEEPELIQVTVLALSQGISVEYELLDYSRFGSSTLTTGSEFAARSLIQKHSVFGEEGLSELERKLLVACWLPLLLAGDELLSESLAMQEEGFTLADAADKAALAAQEFSQDGKLIKLLQDYARALCTNDTVFQQHRRKAITRHYRWITLNPSDLPLYHSLHLRFAEACTGFAGSHSVPPDDDGFRLIDQTLRINGFSGDYPHYRRRYHRTGEYVTIEVNAMPADAAGQNQSTYTFHAGVGHLSGSRRQGYRLGPIPFDQTIAFDCQWERTGLPVNNRYRELFSVTGSDKLGSVLDNLLDAFDGKWLPKENREELYGVIQPKDFFSKGMLFIFAFSGLLFSVIFELAAVALMLLASGIAAIARQSWEPFSMLLDWSIYLKIFLWCFFGGGVGMVIAMLWETRLALGVVTFRRRRRKSVSS